MQKTKQVQIPTPVGVFFFPDRNVAIPYDLARLYHPEVQASVWIGSHEPEYKLAAQLRSSQPFYDFTERSRKQAKRAPSSFSFTTWIEDMDAFLASKKIGVKPSVNAQTSIKVNKQKVGKHRLNVSSREGKRIRNLSFDLSA
jgi:hypothetical protein